MARKAPCDPEQRQRAEREAAERRILLALTPFVEALTDPEETRRSVAVDHVLRTCLPAVVARLIDRLVSLLI